MGSLTLMIWWAPSVEGLGVAVHLGIRKEIERLILARRSRSNDPTSTSSSTSRWRSMTCSKIALMTLSLSSHATVAARVVMISLIALDLPLDRCLYLWHVFLPQPAMPPASSAPSGHFTWNRASFSPCWANRIHP